MKNFALTGAAGYIAPRHVQAIKDTGNNLSAILDPYDGVGYIDKYFPHASYFKEAERFDRHLYRHRGEIDFVSIASPNYLHDAHMRLGLRNGCDVICEKPLVLKLEHLHSLRELEKETGKKINTILQLRYHEGIIALKEKYKNTNQKHIVYLDYITPRGKWYNYSWKGDIDKSGGVASNIGIHFFDMLTWIFGEVDYFEVKNSDLYSKGVLYLKNAEVHYNLSIDEKDLPWMEWKPYRNINIDGEEFEFSDGFTDLHTTSYQEILKGNGLGLDDIEPTINLVEKIRYAKG